MLLYHGARPNPRAVRMFLLEKGIKLEMRDVDVDGGENRRPEFVALNPSGQVPVLELDDGFWLAETGAIFQYLEELYPTPALIGSTSQERAETRMWQRRVERRITEALYAAFHYGPGAKMYASRMRILPECVPGFEALMDDGLAWFDAQLAGRLTIVPGRFTVADIVLFAALDFGATVGWPLVPELTHVGRWFAAVQARPAAGLSLHPRAAVCGIHC